MLLGAWLQARFSWGCSQTDTPKYTEQVFSSKEMAQYALYRNQPFVGVYDNYIENTEYGASAPKYVRRIVSIPSRSRENKDN
jgi:hypothetical protein